MNDESFALALSLKDHRKMKDTKGVKKKEKKKRKTSSIAKIILMLYITYVFLTLNMQH